MKGGYVPGGTSRRWEDKWVVRKRVRRFWSTCPHCGTSMEVRDLKDGDLKECMFCSRPFRVNKTSKICSKRGGMGLLREQEGP